MFKLNQSQAKAFIRHFLAGSETVGPIKGGGHEPNWSRTSAPQNGANAWPGNVFQLILAPARQAEQDGGNIALMPNSKETSNRKPEAFAFGLSERKNSEASNHPDASGSKDQPITSLTRASLLGHRGAIIWLTGLSGSGKSTLAVALEKNLFHTRVLPVVLDGDVLRTGLSQGLGFSDADRKENIRRAAEAALLLAEAGAVVVTALISPFRDDRQHIVDRCKARGVAFAEVFVNAPLAECERRDPKQLYKRARAGQIPSFTGIDSPYEAPLAPALELRTDLESIEQSLAKLTALALALARPSGPAAGAQSADL